jgi:predicted nucleotidyltransferase
VGLLRGGNLSTFGQIGMADIETVTPPVIGSVLFGSRARGDSDEFSDTDICAFFESIDINERLAVRMQLANIYSTQPKSVCMYSRPVVEGLARNGALFIWHLRLESVILYDPVDFVRKLFESVAPYSRYERDISIYEEIALGVASSFKSSLSLNSADLHALFVSLRNTCLLLTMSKGKPVFARKLAGEAAHELFPMLPYDQTAYDLLASEHLHYTRNAPLFQTSHSTEQQKALIEFVLDFIKQSRVQLESTV